MTFIYELLLLYFKVHPLISSGLAYKLRSGALWRRRNSGVQNDANAPSAAPAKSHEPHAGHEGTYHPAARSPCPPPSPDTTVTSHLHTHILTDICTDSITFHNLKKGLHYSIIPLSVICINHPVFCFKLSKVVVHSLALVDLSN